jgi:putative transposase
MDETHTVACARYIERNPVRAGMVGEPWKWKWSSARVHCGMENTDPLNVAKLFQYIEASREKWREFIREKDDPTEIEAIKKQTLKGRPLAAEAFIAELEQKLARVLKLGRRGRPKKEMAGFI